MPTTRTHSPQDLFANIFHYAAIGMALVSPEGKFLKVNKSLALLTGYEEHELMQLTFQDITYPDDLKADLKSLQEVLAGERDTYHMEKRYVTKQNDVVWVELSVSVMRDEDRKVQFFISQIQDINERKKLEISIQEKNQKFLTLLETTHDGYWENDCVHQRFYGSPRLWEMIGQPAKDSTVSFQEIEKLMHPHDIVLATEAFLKHVNSMGKIPFYLEVRYLHSNGHTAWVICRGKVTEWDAAGRPVKMVGSHTDITSLKAAQETMVSNAKMAALGVMASGIAHEINNPLAIIDGFATQIGAWADKGDIEKERLLKSVGNIRRTVTRIAKIVAGMRKFARDGSRDDLAVMDGKQVIEESLVLCKERFLKWGVQFDIQIATSPVLVRCRDIELGQVIVNLLNNAFDAVKEAERKLISLNAQEHENYFEVSIADSGPGIPETVRSRLFDPFFTTKPVGSGTGLGLAISKGIIEGHGGQIYLDPESKETRFVIRLPLAKSALKSAS